MPLVAKGRVIGVADLLDDKQRRFSPDTVATVEAVCHAAAFAIDNANLYEAVQLRRRETELLNDIARRTSSSLELGEIAGATTDELRQMIAFDRADLVLATDAGQLETIYTSAAQAAPHEPHDATPDQRAALETIRRERVVVWDAGAAPSFAGGAGRRGRRGIALLRDETADRRVRALGRRGQGVRRGRPSPAGACRHASLAGHQQRPPLRRDQAHAPGQSQGPELGAERQGLLHAGHAARVGAYVVLLGHELGWSEEQTRQVEEAAYLHDIGKIGVSDRVLLKPSGLNSREWELMRQHPIFSADILRPLFADDLVLGVRHHHEHWDGAGYPDGLAGEAIPLVARAMCIADSYDAMSFRRPYRKALGYRDALAELDRCAGRSSTRRSCSPSNVCSAPSLQRRRAREVAEPAPRASTPRHTPCARRADEDGPSTFSRERAARLRDAHPAGALPDDRRVDDDATCTIIVDAEEAPEDHSPLGSEVFADDELLETFAGRTPTSTCSTSTNGASGSAASPSCATTSGEICRRRVADVAPAGVSGAEMQGLRSDVAQAFASMFQSASARLDRTDLDAVTDGLTGLYNHRYLHERLSEELVRAAVDGHPLSLLFCGLDRFTAFNDLYGHSAGDDALRSVARIIEGCIRHIDLAARYGGEEFAVLLPAATPKPPPKSPSACGAR